MRYLACVLLFFAVATRTYADETNEAHTEKIPLSQAVTLGIIQGITEFLPVSSTGHMIIANECFFHASRQSKNLQAALNNYMVCINLGTLLVLLLFFRKDIRRILNGLRGNDTKGFKLAFNLGIAFIPAGILGLLTDKTLEHFYTPTCVATGLILGSVCIFLTENFRKTHQPCCDDLYDLSVAKALLIGLLQTVALWPGFSRLLATVIGGIWVGLTLTQALRFSFLLGLLTTALATTYKFLKHGDVLLQATDGVTAWLGIAVSFGVGIAVISLLFRFLKNNGLRIFGWYRLALGVLIFCL